MSTQNCADWSSSAFNFCHVFLLIVKVGSVKEGNTVHSLSLTLIRYWISSRRCFIKGEREPICDAVLTNTRSVGTLWPSKLNIFDELMSYWSDVQARTLHCQIPRQLRIWMIKYTCTSEVKGFQVVDGVVGSSMWLGRDAIWLSFLLLTAVYEQHHILPFGLYFTLARWHRQCHILPNLEGSHI